MKKIFLFIVIIVSNYTYASFPENMYGLKLGMDKQSVEKLISKNNLKACQNDVTTPYVFCYYGSDIQILGVDFDRLSVVYDTDNKVKSIIFQSFIPQYEGTQRRIFRHLFDEIKPYARSTKDENIRYNYIFKIRNKKENKFVRISIKDGLHDNAGYYIFLSMAGTKENFMPDIEIIQL